MRLAQTCRVLFHSEQGKFASYINALQSKSMSVPMTFPTNVEYETEVLHRSQWPHNAPPFDPLHPDDHTGLALGCEGFLRGGNYVCLCTQQMYVTCREFNAQALDKGQGRAEYDFGRALSMFEMPSLLLAVDEDATFCARVVQPIFMDGILAHQPVVVARQSIEVRYLGTGTLAGAHTKLFVQ